MSESSPKAVEVAAQIAALRITAIYGQTSLFAALAEKRMIDPARVFALNEVIASGFEQMARATEDPVKRRANEIAAEIIREFERRSGTWRRSRPARGGRELPPVADGTENE
jgi:hypothetical protein